MMITVTDLFDGVTPETSPVTITVVEGAVGADGATGPQGPQGPPGDDGAGVVATVVAPLVLTGDELSFDDSGYEVAGAAAAAQAASQPVDGDLTTIAALDSATAGALVTDGAGWIRKTYAQLKTALSLVKADVGLGSVDNTADTAKPVSTAQQTALDLKVSKSLFDANSLLIATTDDTPVALTVAASRIVGRKASGDIDDLTPAEALAVLSGGGTPDGTKFLRDDNTLATPSSGGVSSGTSFPGSPSNNDLYYRTDRDFLYFYDGTRWLSVQLIAVPAILRDSAASQASSISVNTFVGQGILPYYGTHALWMERMDYSHQYAGGTINASNYWKRGVYWTDSATSRTQIVLSAARTTDTASSCIADTVAIGSQLSGSALRFEFYAEKTGTPPTIACVMATVYCRLVG